MRNVTGGYIKACTMICQVQIEIPNPRNPDGVYYNSNTNVADCSSAGTVQCTNGGGVVIACSCGNL